MGGFCDEAILIVCDVWNDDNEGLSILLPSRLVAHDLIGSSVLNRALVSTTDQKMMWHVEQDLVSGEVTVTFYKRTDVVSFTEKGEK